MKAILKKSLSILAAGAVVSLSLCLTPTIYAEDNIDSQHNLLTVENTDISSWVGERLDDKELAVRQLENSILDNQLNGDIRKLNVCSMLQYLDIPCDCIQRSDYGYQVNYTIDIPNTDWKLDWTLANEFGNAIPHTAEYVLEHYNGSDQRCGYIQVTTGNYITFSTCEDVRVVRFDYEPFRVENGEPPKVIIAEGEASATSFEIALAKLLIEAVESEAQIATTIEPVQSTQPDSGAPLTLPQTFEKAVSNLDLAEISKDISAQLDAGINFKEITASSLLQAKTDYRLETFQEGGTIMFSVKDGLRRVDVNFKDMKAYERPQAIITFHDRHAGCTYTATIDSFMDVTTKKLRVQIPDETLELEFPNYDSTQPNYFINLPNGEQINSETLAIIAMLLELG